MKFPCLFRGAGAALVFAMALASAPARADIVLLGSDYFETIAPTSFTFPVDLSLGPLSGQTLQLAGIPIGPGNTDTIVRRKQDCSLMLNSNGSNCTIPIEMVALSLVSIAMPNVQFRESPSLASSGQMAIFSDGSGMGGTFDSFFDIFVELSIDGGTSFDPLGLLTLQSQGTAWSTTEQGLLVDGLVGDQLANRHTDKATNCPVGPSMVCVDFFLSSINGGPGSVTEVEADPRGLGIHTARHPNQVPEPGSLALISLGLAMAALTARRRHCGRS